MAQLDLQLKVEEEKIEGGAVPPLSEHFEFAGPFYCKGYKRGRYQYRYGRIVLPWDEPLTK